MALILCRNSTEVGLWEIMVKGWWEFKLKMQNSVMDVCSEFGAYRK